MHGNVTVTAPGRTEDAATATTSSPTPVEAVPPKVAKPGSRLAWLDVLRGIAALVVVYEHLGYHVLSKARDFTDQWVNAGTLGVILFFTISGYIIPASLERKGSVRGFWISRIFRLYPLWIAAFAAVVVLRHTGHFAGADPYLQGHKTTSLLAHGTMLQDLLGVQNTVNVMWTLSYEMVFYLLVTGLFVLSLHRFSVEIALLFAAAALLLGSVLPKAELSTTFGVGVVAAIVAAVFVVGIGSTMSGRKWLVVIGGVALAIMALTLVSVNGRAGAWEGLLIPAYMFVGTAIFRAHSGQIRIRKAWFVSIAVLAMVVATDLYNTTQWNLSPQDEMVQRRRWIIAVLLAAALFGAGLLVRNRKLPRVLAWLGQISFSVYLLHPIFILVFVNQLNKFGDTYSNSAPIWQQIGAFVGFIVFIVVCCSVTFKLIEQPMQNLGRTVSRWCDDRFGSDVGLFRSGSAADRAAAASVGVPARAASEQPAP